MWKLRLEYSDLLFLNKESPLNIPNFQEDIEQPRKVRYYQNIAIKKVIEAYEKQQKRILLTMATGTGKTFTAMQIVYKLFKAKKIYKTLFVVDRHLLADQSFEEFKKIMPEGSCYKISSNINEITRRKSFYFGIYQSLVGEDDEGNVIENRCKFKNFPADFFDLIIIDEAHRGARCSKDKTQTSSWFRLLEYFKTATQIGLTATPKSEDTNDTYAHFGKPVFQYSLKKGIDDGFLAPYSVKRVKTDLDTNGYQAKPGDKDIKNQQIEQKLYVQKDFNTKLVIPERIKEYARHLVKHLSNPKNYGKTIVFCSDQKHALDVASACRDVFSEYKSQYDMFKDLTGDFAVRITGDDKDGQGKYQDLEKFKDLTEDFTVPLIVTTSKLLTTGVDIKDIKNIVIFREIKSIVEFKQIVGRGTRIFEEAIRPKKTFCILEYGNDSVNRFRDSEWDGDVAVPEVEIISESLLKGKGEKEDKLLTPLRKKNIRYRMSASFLENEVGITVDEQMDLFGNELRNIGICSIEDLNKIWIKEDERKSLKTKMNDFTGVSLDKLKQILDTKGITDSVDYLDAINHLVFKKPLLIKENRIQKSKNIHSVFFNLKDNKQKSFLTNTLVYYKGSGFETLDCEDPYFWKIPIIQKIGTYTEINSIFNGKVKSFCERLQKRIYDPTI